MHNNFLNPSAAPKRWYGHRQTPQEEHDEITRMEEQYRRDQEQAMKIATTTCYPHDMTGDDDNDMNQELLFHDQYVLPTSPSVFVLRPRPHAAAARPDNSSNMAFLTAAAAAAHMEIEREEQQHNSDHNSSNTTTPTRNFTPLR